LTAIVWTFPPNCKAQSPSPISSATFHASLICTYAVYVCCFSSQDNIFQPRERVRPGRHQEKRERGVVVQSVRHVYNFAESISGARWEGRRDGDACVEWLSLRRRPRRPAQDRERGEARVNVEDLRVLWYGSDSILFQADCCCRRQVSVYPMSRRGSRPWGRKISLT
jgi:hypothetical protein